MIHAEYIGCMKTGAIFKDAQLRWYEPQHELLGGSMYFTHSWGSIYVLSGHIAQDIASIQEGRLRFFNNEGACSTTVLPFDMCIVPVLAWLSMERLVFGVDLLHSLLGLACCSKHTATWVDCAMHSLLGAQVLPICRVFLLILPCHWCRCTRYCVYILSWQRR